MTNENGSPAPAPPAPYSPPKSVAELLNTEPEEIATVGDLFLVRGELAANDEQLQGAVGNLEQITESHRKFLAEAGLSAGGWAAAPKRLADLEEGLSTLQAGLRHAGLESRVERLEAVTTDLDSYTGRSTDMELPGDESMAYYVNGAWRKILDLQERIITLEETEPEPAPADVPEEIWHRLRALEDLVGKGTIHVVRDGTKTVATCFDAFQALNAGLDTLSATVAALQLRVPSGTGTAAPVEGSSESSAGKPVDRGVPPEAEEADRKPEGRPDPRTRPEGGSRPRVSPVDLLGALAQGLAEEMERGEKARAGSLGTVLSAVATSTQASALGEKQLGSLGKAALDPDLDWPIDARLAVMLSVGSALYLRRAEDRRATMETIAERPRRGPSVVTATVKVNGLEDVHRDLDTVRERLGFPPADGLTLTLEEVEQLEGYAAVALDGLEDHPDHADGWALLQRLQAATPGGRERLRRDLLDRNPEAKARVEVQEKAEAQLELLHQAVAEGIAPVPWEVPERPPGKLGHWNGLEWVELSKPATPPGQLEEEVERLKEADTAPTVQPIRPGDQPADLVFPPALPGTEVRFCEWPECHEQGPWEQDSGGSYYCTKHADVPF